LGECDGRVFRIGSIAKPTLAWRAPKQCNGGDKILEFGAGPPLQLQLLWRVGLLLSSRVLTADRAGAEPSSSSRCVALNTKTGFACVLLPC
jgi:hypothetical protein